MVIPYWILLQYLIVIEFAFSSLVNTIEISCTYFYFFSLEKKICRLMSEFSSSFNWKNITLVVCGVTMFSNTENIVTNICVFSGNDGGGHYDVWAGPGLLQWQSGLVLVSMGNGKFVMTYPYLQYHYITSQYHDRCPPRDTYKISYTNISQY